MLVDVQSSEQYGHLLGLGLGGQRLQRIDDVLVGARFLQREFPGKPLVLVGFSFGGPAVWPAALTLLRRLGPARTWTGGASRIPVQVRAPIRR